MQREIPVAMYPEGYPMPFSIVDFAVAWMNVGVGLACYMVWLETNRKLYLTLSLISACSFALITMAALFFWGVVDEGHFIYVATATAVVIGTIAWSTIAMRTIRLMLVVSDKHGV